MIPKISDEVQRELYRDLLQSPVRRVGAAFDRLVELIGQGLSNPMIPAKERFQDYERELELRQANLVSEAVSRIAPERRIYPAPQLAGPILDGCIHEPHGTPLYNMWRNLLSSACDQTLVGNAHPAFPGLIAQLSNDEAKLLTYFGTEDFPVSPLPPMTDPYDPRGATFAAICETVTYPTNADMYLQHLISLGLVQLVGFNAKPEGRFIATFFVYQEAVQHLRFTPFGQVFMAAVSSDQE